MGGEFIHGWGLAGLANPVEHCILPPPPQARNRRLQTGSGDEKGEEERMRAALLAGTDGVEMAALFETLLETAMRLSEVLSVSRDQLEQSAAGRLLALSNTKNGANRNVVLSSRAIRAIDAWLADCPRAPEDRLFRLNVPQVEYRWKQARKAAQISGLRLHDLRHEGLSRMAGKGLTIGELQAQSGHKTAQILIGYINATHEEIARKLG